MQHVTDDERRARLATRHALTPSARVDSPESVVQAMTVLHATEPATVFLSCAARSTRLTAADIDRALYHDRSIVKQLAMRRTLFVFPRDLLPAVWPSASARVASAERNRLAKDVVRSGLARDGHAWIDQARAEVLAHLAGHAEGATAQDLREAIPMIDVKMTTQGVAMSVAPRLLTQLGATADIVRGSNTGPWPTSRPRWTLTSHWLDDVPEPWTAADGYRELIRRWLHTFGPGTEDDIVWWLGATKSVVRAALTELDAVEVSLDSGRTGWLLPSDLEAVPDPGSWVALLPVLDPTVMGWKDRTFVLGPHREQLFDSNGNAGTTILVDGRAVGCWVQDHEGVVAVRLLETINTGARRALAAEAQRLTEWVDGVRIGTTYKSPAMKA